MWERVEWFKHCKLLIMVDRNVSVSYVARCVVVILYITTAMTWLRILNLWLISKLGVDWWIHLTFFVTFSIRGHLSYEITPDCKRGRTLFTFSFLARRHDCQQLSILHKPILQTYLLGHKSKSPKLFELWVRLQQKKTQDSNMTTAAHM